jgi:acyl-coenzyme A thioesterase PaaI-like protein
MPFASDPGGPFPRPRHCFGCGSENDSGLRIDVEYSLEERWCRAPFTPAPFHEGPPGIVHGGIVATVLDEAMAWLATLLGAETGPAVTASLTVKLRSPLRIRDAPFLVEAHHVRTSGRRHLCSGRITDREGRPFATGEGLFLTVPLDDWLVLGD